MNIRALALIAVILFVLPVAGSSHYSQTGSFSLQHIPGFVFSEPNNTSINLSSIGIGFITYGGVYLSPLSNSTWKYSAMGKNGASYMSVVSLHRFFMAGYRNITEYLPFNLSNSSLTGILSENGFQNIGEKLFSFLPREINITFYANLSIVNDSSAMAVSLDNVTSSYAAKNYTELELTFSFITGDKMMPGILFVEQLFMGYSENVVLPHFYHVMVSRGFAGQRNSGLKLGFQNSEFSSYYWWNNTYTESGKTEMLENLTGYGSGWASVVFMYSVPQGSSTIRQDPYFMIPSYSQPSSIGPLPVPPVISSAIDYFVIHIAYFIAGLMISGILLGSTYLLYRKRRIL